VSLSLHRCAEHGYTLGEKCPHCGKPTLGVGPAKYSPEDRFGAYRRKLKAIDRAKKGSA